MLTKLKQNIPAIILFIFFLSLYIYTAAPGVYDGDSGELAAAVNTLGLAHPTGFPLYMLSGKLFTLLVPIKDVAYRLNIFSALLTTTALVFFYYTLKNLGNSPFASLAASLILGLGRNTIWSNAGTARVYALSLLFVSILFFIFSKWRKERKTKYLYWYGFLWGLSLGTHALMLVMAIPPLFMLWQARHIIKERLGILAKIIFLTIIPAVQYIYLFFAYKRNGIVNWGDMSNWDGFIYYITQRQYATKIFANTLSDTGNFLVKIGGLLTSEFTIIFIGVAVAGLIYLLKKERTLSIIFVSIILVNVGMMYGYGKSGDLIILFRYIFIADLVLSLMIAFGLDMVMNWARISKGNRGAMFFTVITILAISLQFKFSYAYNDRRNNFIVEDFAQNIFVTIEPDSILLTSGDTVSNSLWYLQSIGQRDDIIQINADLMVYNWYMASEIKRYPDVFDASILAERQNYNRILNIINKNIANQRIYTTFPAWDEYSNSNFEFVPVGIIYAVVPKKNDEAVKLLQLNKTIWDKYQLRNIKTGLYKDFMLNLLVQHYALSLNNIGVVYASLNLPKESIYFLKKSIDIIPDTRTKENLNKVERNFIQ
ncbi:MAG: DUF2723 domain-containing protein [Candidatus Buchananbacteria bacterium]|nr:DUF2723 domain-containing protein [Candidatus Buchananbacteria bacterium]